jgi:hypothetical protein
MSSSLTKTVGTSVLAMQTVAAATVVIGSAIDVSTILEGILGIRCGRNQEAALTVGVKFRVEGSYAAGQGYWEVIGGCTFQSAIAAAASEALTANPCSAGITTLLGASTSGFTAPCYCSILNTTPANSEFVRVKALQAGTVAFLIEEATINVQTGATIYNQAESFQCGIPAGYSRVRVVVDNMGNATQAALVDAYLNKVTAIG